MPDKKALHMMTVLKAMLEINNAVFGCLSHYLFAKPVRSGRVRAVWPTLQTGRQSSGGGAELQEVLGPRAQSLALSTIHHPVPVCFGNHSEATGNHTPNYSVVNEYKGYSHICLLLYGAQLVEYLLGVWSLDVHQLSMMEGKRQAAEEVHGHL